MKSTFHYGSIKIYTKLIETICFPHLHSTMVLLKLLLIEVSSLKIIDLHSTMVLLK